MTMKREGNQGAALDEIDEDEHHKGASKNDRRQRICCCSKDREGFQGMSTEQRKARIRYLWKRLRIVVRHRGLL